MGASYSSYAVIGVEIDPSKLTTTKKVRVCKCVVENIEKLNFCSACGKKVFEEIEENIPQLTEGDNSPFDFSICGYHIIYNTDHNRAFVAGYWAEDDEYQQSNRREIFTNIEKIKTTMKIP